MGTPQIMVYPARSHWETNCEGSSIVDHDDPFKKSIVKSVWVPSVAAKSEIAGGFSAPP